MIDPANVTLQRGIPKESDGKPDYHAGLRNYTGQDQMNATEADELYRSIKAVYLGCMHYSDMLMGRLLDTLDDLGLTQDTAVFHFADHGDYAGDYGLVEKWPSGLEDALTHVPLVIRAPFLDENAVGNGREEPNLVQLYDIVPTALDIAGIDPLHVHFAQTLIPYLDGSSEAAKARGEVALTADGDPPRDFVFAEGGYSTNEPRDSEGYVDGLPGKSNDYYYKSALQQEHPLTVCRAVSARNLTHKLVVRSDPQDRDHDSELYDLVNDPWEKVNLYDDPGYAGIKTALKEEILEWYIKTSDITPYSICSRTSGECDSEP